MSAISRRQLLQLIIMATWTTLGILKTPGILVDLQNNEGWHAFMLVCVYRHTVVARILNACYDPEQIINQASDEVTSLLLASKNSHKETILLLLQHGADVN